MIYMAFHTVLSLFCILSFTPVGILIGLLLSLASAYIFIVLYSLFAMLRDERERKRAAQFDQPRALQFDHPDGGI
jgi:hypothetical protein